jgi:selenocysteine lyase/cysteine desulfurase
LDFLVGVPGVERQQWCVGQADETAKLLGLPATGSSVLAVPVDRPGDVAAALRGADIVTSVPPPTGTGTDAQVRLSFHLYNDSDDAQLAAEVLQPFVRQPRGSAS